MIKLVTADWHLKVPTNKRKADWYMNRISSFISKLNQTIKEYNVDEIDLLGDVFDKKPTYLDVSLLLKVVNSVLWRFPKLKINVIHGNHDFYRTRFFLIDILPYINERVELFSSLHETDDFIYVDNPFIRYGGKIPPKYDKIVFSHIACKLPQFNKDSEYDFEELKKYKFVLLGDIHSAFKIEDNIYYTGSPYRTHRLRINDLNEINNSGHGVLIFDTKTLSIKKVEFNLPNSYILVSDKKIEKDIFNQVEDYIETEYIMSVDNIKNLTIEENESLKILKDSDIQLAKKQSNIEALIEILNKKYNISDTAPYISLLEKVYPEFTKEG